MPSGRSPIASLPKSLRVLEAIATASSEGQLRQVADKTGLDRATIHRVLRTLLEAGYLSRVNRGEYVLSARGFALGLTLTTSYRLAEVALPAMRELQSKIGETVNLAVLEGADVLYVQRLPTTRILSISLQVGSRLPAYCTSLGRAILAFISRDEALAILARSERRALTEHTITELAPLERELDRIRQCGYAVTDSELELGLRSVACPIRNCSGAAIAAMNVSVPAARFDGRSVLTTLLPPLAEACADLSSAFGWPPDQLSTAAGGAADLDARGDSLQ